MKVFETEFSHKLVICEPLPQQLAHSHCKHTEKVHRSRKYLYNKTVIYAILP